MLKLFSSVGFRVVKTLKRWFKIQSPSLMLTPNIKDVKTINIEDWQQFLETIEDIYQRSIYYGEEE